MNPEPPRFPWPKWPFYVADALLIGLAAELFLRDRGAPEVWRVVGLLVNLATGACLSLLPHWLDRVWAREGWTGSGPESENDDRSAAGEDAPEALADLAVLAWRILKRAEQDPETHRVILRHAGKLLEALERCEVRVVSYLGRKIDVGSNVQILDAVPGEYNRVLEESEPQVQVRGRLARRAIVTIGAGPPASTPASDPITPPI